MVEITVAQLERPRERVHFRCNSSLLLLILVAVLCAFQLWWFGRVCFNEIDADGMSYTGIARHIRAGELRASINAFRSPLISWMIAAVPFGSELHIGKFINAASYLLSIAALYVLTARLWHSRFAGSVAALLFALARGYAAYAVEIVTPDFLFAFLVLVYFILLLRALRTKNLFDWLLLGAVHGLAFLAKGFALPWLGVCTVIALTVSRGSLRSRISRLLIAALIPILIAAGWAAVLHSKYGVFTTGSQFKTNLLQWTLHRLHDPGPSPYRVLADVANKIDQYGVGDPMPPGSWAWSYRPEKREMIRGIFAAEIRNVPLVLKELLIVATPGGLLAFIFGLAMAGRHRTVFPAEWTLVLVITASAVTLVLAYSMLVFDDRYLFPLLPLLLAVSAGFLAGDAGVQYPIWHKVCLSLVAFGIVFSLAYHASPFRLLTREFDSACHDAGQTLRAHGASRVVTLGVGPFPEHGIGWEAGYKAAYFGDERVVATLESLPDAAHTAPLVADLATASPDAILIWGRPDDGRRQALIQQIAGADRYRSVSTITDPVLGEVGAILLKNQAQLTPPTPVRIRAMRRDVLQRPEGTLFVN